MRMYVRCAWHSRDFVVIRVGVCCCCLHVLYPCHRCWRGAAAPGLWSKAAALRAAGLLPLAACRVRQHPAAQRAILLATQQARDEAHLRVARRRRRRGQGAVSEDCRAAQRAAYAAAPAPANADALTSFQRRDSALELPPSCQLARVVQRLPCPSLHSLSAAPADSSAGCPPARPRAPPCFQQSVVLTARLIAPRAPAATLAPSPGGPRSAPALPSSQRFTPASSNVNPCD